MARKIVYRVEKLSKSLPHEQVGRGPYCSAPKKWRTTVHDDSTGRPGPIYEDWRNGLTWDEIQHRTDYDAHFGFATQAQLRAWFHVEAERERLAKMGFGVSVIKAEKLFRGEKQVAFVPKERIKHEPLEKFFPEKRAS
jgi:hypothetical protein